LSDDLYFKVLEKTVDYSPLAKLKEPKLHAAEFSPQFSVKHMHQDMRLAAATLAPAALPFLDNVIVTVTARRSHRPRPRQFFRADHVAQVLTR
jgi:3-hydroxyisobutyrate dehydrogenase-like beta-hydroxyacid dehydrogenase